MEKNICHWSTMSLFNWKKRSNGTFVFILGDQLWFNSGYAPGIIIIYCKRVQH